MGVGGGGRDGERPRSQEVEERWRLYLALHCHQQNESCIKMGSEESRFNVSLIVADKVTKAVSIQTINFQRSRTEVEVFRLNYQPKPVLTRLRLTSLNQS